MTELTSESDRSVRQAVEAYLSGALRPHFQGEAQFETRNSRYRLADGVLFHVGRDGQSDGHFIGAELVGWLYEGPEDSRIDATWRPGARAVLVDAHRSRRIVVTSATRGYACVPVPATGSRAPQPGSNAIHTRPAAPPPRPTRTAQSTSAPLLQIVGASSPDITPPPVALRNPPRRPTSVHPPPRPVGPRAATPPPPPRPAGARAAMPPPPRPALPSRPLPYPTPPPTRAASPVAATRAPLPAVTPPPRRASVADPAIPPRLAAVPTGSPQAFRNFHQGFGAEGAVRRPGAPNVDQGLR